MGLSIIESEKFDYTILYDDAGNQALHTGDGMIVFLGVSSKNIACFRDILSLRCITPELLSQFNSLEEFREYLIKEVL